MNSTTIAGMAAPVVASAWRSPNAPSGLSPDAAVSFPLEKQIVMPPEHPPGRGTVLAEFFAAAAVFAARNPKMGYCEPERLPHDEILRIAAPYLGPVVSVPTDWNPLVNRTKMFPEPYLDRDDPWQFANFLIQ